MVLVLFGASAGTAALAELGVDLGEPLLAENLLDASEDLAFLSHDVRGREIIDGRDGDVPGRGRGRELLDLADRRLG